MATRRTESPRAVRRRGHTLMELVVALAVLGILAVGVASALLIASRATDPASPMHATHEAAEAVDGVQDDLQFATGFSERGGRAVTFTVPDRGGDGSPETIRYAWSGTAGDPLTRQYNGGAPTVVIDDVRQFHLAYSLHTVTEEPDPTRNESGETLLASHDTPDDAEDQEIKEKTWLGQYISPSLPADAVAWRVTRVLVKARVHGADNGVAGVQLRLPNASNLPSRTVLEEVPMYEDRLTDEYLWHEFRFSSVSGLDPGRGLCLTVACIRDDADLCDVRYDEQGSGGMCLATGGEGTWANQPSHTMLFAMYGTVTTADDPDPVTRSWLRGITIRLRAGVDPSTAAETTAQILNAPEVTP